MKFPVWLSLGAALLARTAAAEPPRSEDVVIVGEPGDRLVQNLRAQLNESRLGSRVAPPSTLALQDIAAAEHATAVIRVAPTHDELQVWLARWQAGRPLLDMRLRSAPNGDEEALVQQCVELLREIAESATEPTPAKPTTRASDARTHEPSVVPQTARTRLRLELGAAYNLAGSRLQWASLDGAVGLSSTHWFALVRGSAPWASAVITEPQGRAQVQSSSFGMSAGLSWKPTRLHLRAGATLGTRTLRIIGTDSRAQVKSEQASQLEAGLETILEYRARLPMFLGLRATFVTPRARVRFFEIERASFGPLAFSAQLGFAFDGPG